MKNKTLDEIRPSTKGVRANKMPIVQKPKVIKDVQPPTENIPPPSEEAARIVIASNRAREKLVESIKGINRLMVRQVLPENRSVKENEEEKAAIANLVNAALSMEEFSSGEGLLGMVTLALRQGLSLRDAGNRLACELEQVKRELAEFKGKNNG